MKLVFNGGWVFRVFILGSFFVFRFRVVFGFFIVFFVGFSKFNILIFRYLKVCVRFFFSRFSIKREDEVRLF